MENTAALQSLLTRRSRWPLQEPAPSDAELAQILDAAACAPDHAQLRPWRFQYVRGQARHALVQRVLQHPDAQIDEVRALKGKYTAKLTTAPLVIVLAAHITEHPKAPEFEQYLAAGAAVMNMLNAAHALGYSGFWSSTPGHLGALLHKVMGFEPQDRMIGLLNLGYPAMVTEPLLRTPHNAYAKPWNG